MNHQDEKKTYTVYVDDNFHFMDEGERLPGGAFGDCESARRFCRAIVDAYLKGVFQPGMDWRELFKSYKTFGEDPWISSLDQGCQFSAWDYAERRCREICASQP